MINKILLYDRLLSEAEITQNFNAGGVAGELAVVPEPGTLGVMAVGLIAVVFRRRRWEKAGVRGGERGRESN